MKLLTTQPDRDWRDVPAFVLYAEVPVTNSMTNTVDDSGSPEWNPYHLRTPYEGTDEESKQIDIDAEHHENSESVASSKNVALEPVIGCSLAILLENPRLPDSVSIVKGSLEYDVAQPFHYRTMRIAFAVGKRVVLSMARHPLLGNNGSGQPKPKSHGQCSQKMKLDTAMGLCPVQEQRDTNVGDMTSNDDE